MGPLGVQEMVVIFLVALVLFGPRKLPELGKTIARGMTEFRRAQSELKATLQQHMGELERENESLKEITRSYSNDVYNSYYDSYNYDSQSYGGESYDSGSQPASDTSTTGASATQGAEASQQASETASENDAAVNGTVPRRPAGSTDAGSRDEQPTGSPAASA